MKIPDWLAAARAKVGIAEIAGGRHNTAILGWLRKLKAWWSDDETPWCGTFVAICFDEVGLPVPKDWYRALAWRGYGLNLRPDRLAPGAILVFDGGPSRPGAGHVGFYVGERADGYRVLGGNQSNRVSETWIAKSRLVASRWPEGRPVAGGPIQLAASGNLSTSEA